MRSTATLCVQEQQRDERVDDDTDLPTSMQSLLCLLKNLNQSLEKSDRTGTPAIHMYSILDQIAALHDEFKQLELDRDEYGLHAIDAELICILKRCKDDEKRKRVRPKADVLVNETPFWLIAFLLVFRALYTKYTDALFVNRSGHIVISWVSSEEICEIHPASPHPASPPALST